MQEDSQTGLYFRLLHVDQMTDDECHNYYCIIRFLWMPAIIRFAASNVELDT